MLHQSKWISFGTDFADRIFCFDHVNTITHFVFYRALIELQDKPSKQPQSTVSNSYESPDDKIIHGMMSGDMNVDRIKSAISVVQEIAQKRDLPIRFVVESETGPAHMKHFIIKCSVGEIEVSIYSYYVFNIGKRQINNPIVHHNAVSTDDR